MRIYEALLNFRYWVERNFTVSERIALFFLFVIILLTTLQAVK